MSVQNKLIQKFRQQSVGVIIITSCVAVVVILVISIVITTYQNFRASSREAVNTQTRELSSQIVYNYEQYIATVIDTSNIVQTDIDKYNNSYQLSEFLGGIVHLKNDILKIALYDFETGRCLASSDMEELAQNNNNRDSSWFSQAARDPTIHIFSVPYSDPVSDEYKVNISKLIQMENYSKSGILKIEISFQSFIELARKSNLGQDGHISIIDADYNVVYSSTGQQAAREEMAVIRSFVLGSSDISIGKHNMTVHVDTLSNTKWRICVFINIDKLIDIERGFVTGILFVSVTVLAVGVLLFWRTSKLITTPIRQLERAMRKVEKSDYFRMEEVVLPAPYEVEALTRRFNKMMHKINELMERVKEEQNAQRKSELKALQNQINPHFLYNALDSIVWLVENNKNEEAGEMVVALAKLFRISISKDQERIPVRDEIEHVRSYLLIQNIRYADSFDYSFDVAEDTLDCITIKLVLQPLVENSIYHGLKNKIDRGSIKISAHKDEQYLYLSVSDTGYGIRQEAIDTLFKSFADGVISNGVGLKNIYQRVMIYYGGNAEMRIESELDEGTTITIKEPLTT